MTAITPELLAEIEATAKAAQVVDERTPYKTFCNAWFAQLDMMDPANTLAFVAHVREVERERDAAREHAKDARLREKAAEDKRIHDTDALAADLAHVTAGWKSAMERAKAERDALDARLKVAESVCDEIQMIMRTYREQEAKGRIDTPGGLEHMGDVWALLSKWVARLTDEAASKGDEA